MASIGSLTADLRLESAAFIRDLGKASNAVAANTGRMTKSLEGVRRAANVAAGSLAGFVTLRTIRKVVNFTNEAVKLAATFDGPLKQSANNFIQQSQKLDEALKFGFAAGFLDELGKGANLTDQEMKELVDTTEQFGRIAANVFQQVSALARELATPIREIRDAIDFIGTHSSGQSFDALGDWLTGSERGPMLSFEAMHSELAGQGTSAWENYTKSVKQANTELAQTSKVINVAFPDIEKLRKQQFEASLQMTQSWLGVADTVGQALGTLFKDNKAVAIAQAVINTAQAITSALALPFPLNWAQVAAVTALGAAQIATISSTNPGSSGSGKAMKKGNGGANKTQKAVTETSTSSGGTGGHAINITLQGEGGFSREQVRALIGQINSAVGDGATIRASG
jgi:hypothetical protein